MIHSNSKFKITTLKWISYKMIQDFCLNFKKILILISHFPKKSPTNLKRKEFNTLQKLKINVGNNPPLQQYSILLIH